MDTVNELVYDVLVSKVRTQLNGISNLPIWSAVEEQTAFHLPSFSAYPQSYVTTVGEYLLTLPQQLEPLAECISNNDANAEEAQFFATEWIFKVIYILLCWSPIYENVLLHFLCWKIIATFEGNRGGDLNQFNCK